MAMGERLRAPATKLFGTHEEEEEEEEEKIRSHLQSLRKVLAEFLDWRVADEKRRLDYLETSEAERRRIGNEFERLRRLLDEKERTVLQRLAELDAAFEAAQAEKASRVAEEIARLHGLIGQLEAGRLPQDTGSSLSSWNEARLQLPPELEKSLRSCRHQHAALEEALKELRDPGRPKPKLETGKILSTEEKASRKTQRPAHRCWPLFRWPRRLLGTMAQRKAVRSLQEEATCAICLDFFHQPVMLLACGHNFCRSCFTRCAEEGHDGAGSCPQCRLPFPPEGFCPNRQLANMVAVVRELVEGEQDLCLQDGSRARGADLEHHVPLAKPLEDQQEPTPSSSAPQEHLRPPQNKPQEDERAATRRMPPGGAQQVLLARVEAEKQKLLAMLWGLQGLKGQQKSWLLARLGHLRRRLEEAKNWQGSGNRW
ncbi:uncharacterized protein V3H86_013714, partial [Mergus octosetaceus]